MFNLFTFIRLENLQAASVIVIIIIGIGDIILLYYYSMSQCISCT